MEETAFHLINDCPVHTEFRQKPFCTPKINFIALTKILHLKELINNTLKILKKANFINKNLPSKGPNHHTEGKEILTRSKQDTTRVQRDPKMAKRESNTGSKRVPHESKSTWVQPEPNMVPTRTNTIPTRTQHQLNKISKQVQLDQY